MYNSNHDSNCLQCNNWWKGLTKRCVSLPNKLGIWVRDESLLSLPLGRLGFYLSIFSLLCSVLFLSILLCCQKLRWKNCC
ncbi:hypothetical protein VNO80_17344 [Phaseolus coccineus]|uniref:Uncharacterized protein n=1 Tax=Phaseolus coccineus TaxID=3886 RepID=A0AAN9MNL1_PHACN